jgi:hypothetical protein
MGGGQWLAKLERVASREALAQQVVECTALEMRRRCKPIGGSNPSLSANPQYSLRNPINTSISRVAGFSWCRTTVSTRGTVTTALVASISYSRRARAPS